MTDIDIEARKATKHVIGIIKSANVKLSIWFYVVAAAVVTLAAFDHWRWAWLVLVLAAFKAMLDGPLGIVASVTGAMMQLAQIDERLKQALRG